MNEHDRSCHRPTVPPVTLVLRDYQTDFVNRLRASLATNQVIVACAPTGMGKTQVAAFMVRSANSKGHAAMMTVHRSYLVDQTELTFQRADIDHAFVAVGKPWNPYKRALIASVDTLRNRLERVPVPRLLLVDEGHHAVSASWRKVIAWAVEGGAKVVLFSATPERLDGRGLGEIATDIVEGPTTEWLIENGHLSRYRAYAPSAPDLSGVRTTAGDFNQGDLGDAMDKAALVGDMVTHWRRYADGRRSVYFCVSIAHSEHVAAAFNAAGIPAQHIDGDTDPAERLRAARRFARGEIKVLTNCALVSEGYDLAAQAGMDVSIECVGLARPTQSMAMHLQQLGRVLRTSPGKTHGLILDHAGNLAAHGLPDDPREWSLEGRKRTKKADADNTPAVRTCTACFGSFRATIRACPYCGHETPMQAREIEHVDGELQEVDVEAARRQRKMQEQNAKSVEDLIAVGRSRGFKNPEAWAAHVFTGRAAAKRRAIEARYRGQEEQRLW